MTIKSQLDMRNVEKKSFLSQRFIRKVWQGKCDIRNGNKKVFHACSLKTIHLSSSTV